MPPKLVVFDISGTTVGNGREVSKAIGVAFSAFGYKIPEAAICRLMGYEKRHMIGQLLQEYSPHPNVEQQKRVADIYERFIAEITRYYQEEPIEMLPNVERTFRALRSAGIKVGIDTGFSKDIAETIAERLKWKADRLIDVMVASDEVALGRPHPYMIARMREVLRIQDPAAVAKVGDTEADIREGQHAGCSFVIGVTTGMYTHSQLEAFRPTHIVHDIADILPILSRGVDPVPL